MGKVRRLKIEGIILGLPYWHDSAAMKAFVEFVMQEIINAK